MTNQNITTPHDGHVYLHSVFQKLGSIKNYRDRSLWYRMHQRTTEILTQQNQTDGLNQRYFNNVVNKINHFEKFNDDSHLYRRLLFAAPLSRQNLIP